MLNQNQTAVLQELVMLRIHQRKLQEAHSEMYGAGVEVKHDDPDTEKYIRFEVERTRRLNALVHLTLKFEKLVHSFLDELAPKAEAVVELAQ